MELGQFNQRDLRASGAQSWDGFAIDAAIDNQRTDNYRKHNAFKQDSFSGGAQWSIRGGRIGVRVDSARQDADFPGSLTLAQFNADPRQTKTPKDFGAVATDRFASFAEYRIGSVDLAAELSHRQKKVESSYDFSGFTSAAKYDSEQTQFSPRLRQLTQFGNSVNELVAGIDLIKWYRTTTAGYSMADASQKSKGYYARDEIKWDNARLAVGARHETFEKDYVDPFSFTPAPEHTSQSQNAWEVQGSFVAAPKVNLYAKAGQSYRVANSDENSYRSSVGALKIQTSHDLELGLTLGDSVQQVTARAFRHKLNNEIFFDPTIGYGTNTNLDPTKRQGFELDGFANVGPAWRVNGHLQHVTAQFTEGKNAGHDMVLVPKNIVSARLSWLPNDGQSADIGAQWVDSQRYGSDFTNSCSGRIPSFTTLDARYARKVGAWELAVSGLNLADKQYFSNAYTCNGGLYPADGRQLKISARYDF